MIDSENLFNQSVHNDIRTSENMTTVATSLQDNYTTDRLLDYIFSDENYTLTATSLS